MPWNIPDWLANLLTVSAQSTGRPWAGANPRPTAIPGGWYRGYGPQSQQVSPAAGPINPALAAQFANPQYTPPSQGTQPSYYGYTPAQVGPSYYGYMPGGIPGYQMSAQAQQPNVPTWYNWTPPQYYGGNIGYGAGAIVGGSQWGPNQFGLGAHKVSNKGRGGKRSSGYNAGNWKRETWGEVQNKIKETRSIYAPAAVLGNPQSTQAQQQTGGMEPNPWVANMTQWKPY